MKTILLLLFALIAQTGAGAAPACCSPSPPASGPFSDKSILQVESTWTSDYGKELKLAQLRGRVQIVTLFFTSCQYACPILVHDMKKIEAALAEAGLGEAGYVLVTMDTRRDTVARLHEFRLGQSLNDNWLLLRGEPEDTLELGLLLGVKYKQEANVQFAHSNVITLLDKNGEIAHQQVGLNTDPAALISALKALK